VKDPDPDVADGGREEIPTRGRLQRGRRVALLLISAGFLSGLLFLGTLQSDGFSTWAVNRLARRFNPYPHTRLTVDRVSGSWIRSLHLVGVRLVPVGEEQVGVPRLALDTLAVRFRLLPLLVRRVELSEVVVAGLRAAVTQGPDSTWDFLAPFPGGRDAPADGGLAVRSGPIRVRGAAVRVNFFSALGVRDLDRLELEDVGLVLSGIEAGRGSLSARLDSLHVRFLPPGEVMDRVLLEGTIHLEDRRVEIPRLTLRSGVSDVSAEGSFLLPGREGGEMEEADFRFAANPLAFRDLSGFLRTLDPDVTGQIDLRLEGRSSRVAVSGKGTFSDGGILEAKGVLSPSPSSGPVEYRIELRADSIRLDSFLGEGSLGGRVSGLLSVGLAGHDLELLTGDVSAKVRGLRIGNRVLRPLEAVGGLVDGDARVAVEGGVEGVGAVRFTVEGRPLTPEATLEVRGSFIQDASGPDAPGSAADENTLERLGLRGVETGFSMRTRGFSPSSAVGDLSMETLAGWCGETSLKGGTLALSWEDGSGGFEIAQPLGSGRLEGVGHVEWWGGPGTGGERHRPLHFSVPRLEIIEVDLLRLLGNTVESRVNGRLSLSGTGFDLETLRTEASLRLGRSRVGRLVVDSALITPRMEGGSLRAVVDGWLGKAGEGEPIPGGSGSLSEPGDTLHVRSGSDVRSHGGQIHADLRAEPFGPHPFVTMDTLSFTGVNLASVGGPLSDLHGTAHGRLDGFDLRRGEGSGQITLFPSHIRDASLESGEMMLSLAGGEVRVSGRLTSPDGALRLRGGLEPFAHPIGFSLDEGQVRGLNVGAFLARDGLRSDLNLDLGVSGTGGFRRELTATGHVLLHPSTLNRGVLEEGRLTLEARDGKGVATGRIRTGDGWISLSADAYVGAGLDSLRAAAEVDMADLAGFLGRAEGSLGVGGKLSLAWSDEGDLRFSTALRGRMEDSAIDTLTLEGSVGRSVLLLDTLSVRSELLRADGAGRMARGPAGEAVAGSDLRVVVTLLRPSPIGRALGMTNMTVGPGSGEFHVTGRAEGRSLSGSLDLAHWMVRGVRGDSARIRGSFGAEDSRLTVWAQMPNGSGSMDLSVRAHPGPEERRGTLERFALISPHGEWILAAPTSFSWKDGVHVDNLALVSGEGRIAIDGAIDRGGQRALKLVMDKAPLSGIAGFLGRRDLDVQASGRMDLTGTPDAFRASGNLALELALLETSPTTVGIDYAFSDGEVSIDARATDATGGELRLAGSVPLALAFARGRNSASAPQAASPSPSPKVMDLRLQSRAFDLSWARGLFPSGSVQALEGVLTADARASGPPDRPDLKGRIDLEHGLLRAGGAGVPYREITLSADFHDQNLRIDRASARSGGGTAQVRGSLAFDGLTPRGVDLTARMDRFLAWNGPAVSTVLTGDLALGGTSEAPDLSGTLDIEGTRVRLDNLSLGEQVHDVEFTEEDYRMLEEYFGIEAKRPEAEPFQPMDRFGMDLAVTFDQGVWVEKAGRPRITLEIRGDLEIQKEPTRDLRVLGTLEVLPERSYFRQFGRRFAVREGELNLNGDLSDYTFQLDADWAAPSYDNPDESEVVVTLEVVGSPDSLRLTLGSEPEMDEADIVSYLATGRPQMAWSSTGSEVEGAGLGASMAMGAMSGVLESLAEETVKLDVVEMRVDPVKGATLIAGRYVTPDLYLGFRQPVTFSESDKRGRTQNQYSEVEVDYRWFRWLTANLQGGAGELRLYLKTRHVY